MGDNWVMFYFLSLQSMLQGIYLCNIISTPMCLPVGQIPGNSFTSCSLHAYWVPGWGLMLGNTICLSFTLKSQHTVMQQCMIHYCEPQIMAVNINSQGTKQPQQQPFLEGCNSFDTKSTIGSAPMLGPATRVLYFPQTFCTHLWNPGLLMSQGEVSWDTGLTVLKSG